MHEVDELIRRFRQEETSKIDNVDHSEKPEIIQSLEDFADEPRVLDLLVSVAIDEGEYDLARIEALKVLRLQNYSDREIRNTIADALTHVLMKSADNQVRNYAAMAAGTYISEDDLFSVVRDIVLDPRQDSDLRWNAFAAVKHAKTLPGAIDVLRSLVSDPEFRASAERLLSEWRA